MSKYAPFFVKPLKRLRYGAYVRSLRSGLWGTGRRERV
jgi:hypothetical protein